MARAAGREDGRSRNYIFLQMGLLALAVFAGEASGADGKPFAITYAVLFALLTWQWFVVQRVDDDTRYRPTSIRWIAGMVASVAVMGASAFAADTLRVTLWALVVVGWVIGGLVLVVGDHTEGFGEGVAGSPPCCPPWLRGRPMPRRPRSRVASSRSAGSDSWRSERASVA